jgi:amino acid transporter
MSVAQAAPGLDRGKAELRKELTTRDLVFSQLLYIIGLTWFGTAGQLGASHAMFWIPAVLLFYIPSALVVVHLTTHMPIEGGLYQWAKIRLGPRAGFLAALNLWAMMTLLMASVTDTITGNLSYAFPTQSTAILADPVSVVITSLALTCGLMFAAHRGLALAKWFHNLGGLLLVLVSISLIGFAMPRWLDGVAASTPASLALPAFSLLNLNLLGKMSFGAFCGFDGASIFSDEVKDPNVARAIRRSIWIAAPLIAVVYLCGTASVLTFTSPKDIDLVAPALQMLRQATAGNASLAFVAPLAAIVVVYTFLAQSSLVFNTLIRLPMVAGWDHILPQWMSRLHPIHKTPTGSIVLIGITIFAVTLLSHVGVGRQESFQILWNAGLICWSITYLMMFAIPLLDTSRTPLRLRLACVSGFAMTLLFAIASIFPIIDVADVGAFAGKVALTVAGINIAGNFYYGWKVRP